MDYSLLLGVEHNTDKGNSQSLDTLAKTGEKLPSMLRDIALHEMKDKRAGPNRLRNCLVSENKKELYHISIIDYLQFFNWKKKLERSYFGVVSSKPDKISCQKPEVYQKRFFKFARREVFTQE